MSCSTAARFCSGVSPSSARGRTPEAGHETATTLWVHRVGWILPEGLPPERAVQVLPRLPAPQRVLTGVDADPLPPEGGIRLRFYARQQFVFGEQHRHQIRHGESLAKNAPSPGKIGPPRNQQLIARSRVHTLLTPAISEREPAAISTTAVPPCCQVLTPGRSPRVPLGRRVPPSWPSCLRIPNFRIRPISTPSKWLRRTWSGDGCHSSARSGR